MLFGYEFPTVTVIILAIFVLCRIVWKMEDGNRERARMDRLHKATRERRQK